MDNNPNDPIRSEPDNQLPAPDVANAFAPPPPPPSPEPSPTYANPQHVPPPGPAPSYNPGYPSTGGPVGGDRAVTTNDERLWATFMHLSPVIVGIIGSMTVLPMLSFLGPLILWLIKRNESPFLDDQGKEALNFSITASLAFLICFPLVFILIGIPLMILVGIGALVFAIIGAINANNGVRYRYPVCLRFIK